MSKKPFLSVIIPSYNELENFNRGVLDEVNDYLKKQKYEWEVILSDDGSTDSTPEKLDQYAKKHPGFKVLHNSHAGKGPTVQSGILAAKGEWRLFTDFDQSTPISEIEKLWPFTQKNIKIVIGSREGSGAMRDKEPWYRHVMGRGFNFLVQVLAVPGIRDTQCGFKLFEGEVAHQIFSSLHVYGRKKDRTDAFTGAFDVEALYLARKLGIKIVEVPIKWKHFHTDRVSPLKDSIRMLNDIIKIRLSSLAGKYKR